MKKIVMRTVVAMAVIAIAAVGSVLGVMSRVLDRVDKNYNKSHLTF